MNFLTSILAEVSRRYPGCWQIIDEMRERRGRNGIPDWPNYCFLPLAGSFAIVSGGNKLTTGQILSYGSDIARLGALAAWRVSQRIYRFDPELFEELWNTAVTDIPTEIFKKLPEWCIYIEIPKPPVRGVFVHLECDANTGREELRFVFDQVDGKLDQLLPILLHLNKNTVADSLESVYQEAEKQKQAHSINVEFERQGESENPRANILPNALSLVLYLCSVNADYDRPETPLPKRTKRGLRLFSPDAPKILEVGISVGAALRRAYAYHRENDADGLGSAVRPHVRRAHYHQFWTGPKKTDQELIVKWLSPILVNIDKGDIETTERAVKGE
ncbi:MAG TPA: hypothetical protein V6C97_21110 [Oculatellaceae cyanobacterium]